MEESVIFHIILQSKSFQKPDLQIGYPKIKKVCLGK